MQGEAKSKLNEYLDEIAIASKLHQSTINQNPAGTWSLAAKNIIKKIILDTFKAYNINNSLNFQFYICGSLAKEQATPYSDLDGFIIWEDPKGDQPKLDEIAKIKVALAGMNNLFQRIFEETNQFSPDPLGITPFSYQGTPQELYNKIVDNEVADVTTFLSSISTARPLTGSNSLLEELANKFQDTPEMEVSTPQKLYNEIVENYSGPHSKEIINIKRDIFRPLDFMLMALRTQHNITLEDGSHLVSVNTINELVQQGHFSAEFGDLLLSIFKDAIQLRFMRHQEAQCENDEIDLTLPSLPENQKVFIENLIHKVAILRGVAKQQLEMIENGEEPSLNKIELTSISEVPHHDRSYTRSEMTMDISSFVFNNPARSYFESQRPLIRQNLAKINFNQEGSLETLFQGIKQAPQHLNYLSLALTECFEPYNEGIPEAGLNLKLDSKKFSEWCNILLQSAVSDLFDNKGDFLPWIKKILISGNLGEILLDQKNLDSAKVNKIKCALLSAYITNISGELIRSNPVIQSFDSKGRSKEIWSEINAEIKTTLDKTQSFQIEQLITAHDKYYGKALTKLNLLISDGIKLLSEIRPQTANKKILALIDQRIATYHQLSVDINLVAESNLESSNSTKSSFFHKAYHFFHQDFSDFEQKIKSQERSLWSKFKENFGFIQHKMHSFFTNSETKIYTFSEKKEKLKDFIEGTEHDFKLFSDEAAKGINAPQEKAEQEINIECNFK